MATEIKTKSKTYLTFALAQETYSVDVSKVREVLEVTNITKIPQTPDFMRGVINLRGNVVPVIDMRTKFDMEKTDNTINTCIVVMEIEVNNEKIILGALTDSVKEVIELDSNQIEAAPHIGSTLKTEFIKGMGKHEEEFVIILDIDKVFSVDDLEMVNQSTTGISDTA